MCYRFFICMLIPIFSCQSPEPRYPVVKNSGHFLKESAMRNKTLQEREEKQIHQIIRQDSTRHYINSQNGFWYRYITQNDQNTATPGFGDTVQFSYEISTLEGQTVYTREEIGMREYNMDQEDLFTGLRKGLKIMKEGETVEFLFPSSVAFGYYGDENKIGPNMPVKVTVTVTSILKNQ